MKHKIKFADIEDFRVERELAGSYGKGDHKSLVVVVDLESKLVHFEVFNHRKVIASLPTITEAIEAYNNS